MECGHPLAQEPPDVPARADLLAEGWVRRFVADPVRAREAMELYPRMGFEVRAEPMSPAEVGPACASCPSNSCPLYVVLYTRRRA